MTRQGAPFAEDAPPAPLSAYGRTKLAGEHAVLAACPGACVVRAAGVFSGGGSDFPSAMWRWPKPAQISAWWTTS